MIHFIYGDDLPRFPLLRKTMFTDRATQFRDRLDWDVTVNAAGEETDEYDALNPLYVIWQEPDGRHGGSMRTLPTIGRTMTNEHFQHLTEGTQLVSPLIWETTRFCLAPGAGAGVAAALMLAGCELGMRIGLEHALAVFDARMVRIYSRIGFVPDVIGTSGTGRSAVSLGLWTFSDAARAEISERSAIPLETAARWYDTAFWVRAQASDLAEAVA